MNRAARPPAAAPALDRRAGADRAGRGRRLVTVRSGPGPSVRPAFGGSPGRFGGTQRRI